MNFNLWSVCFLSVIVNKIHIKNRKVLQQMLYKIKNRNVSLQYHSFNFQSTKKNIWKIKLGLVTYHLESEQNIVKIDYETI